MTFITVPTLSLQQSVVLTWLEALSRFDTETLGALLAEDYISAIRPTSMGQPDKGKEAGLKLASSTKTLFGENEIKIEIYDLVETQRKVWVHARLTSETTTGVKYNSESIFMFTFGENVEPKIKKITEFCDSQVSKEFGEKLRQGL
ncbi:hypothetical protein EW146_g3341 [Bondarzewia mesenterica]|uniref:SnoaL-like domain-containing protein n=1 Tax=Bondarzewia mesenterica TaxID=1095465 RepID=A0A4S4LY42_9AGAM|nr:hypothetical protein EW146_g3341 [Bondarzewia mesenterica]